MTISAGLYMPAVGVMLEIKSLSNFQKSKVKVETLGTRSDKYLFIGAVALEYLLVIQKGLKNTIMKY